MLLSSDSQHDGEQPPEIFQHVRLLNPIGNNSIIKSNFLRLKTLQKCQLFLFESFILMNIKEQVYRADIDMTIGFQINQPSNKLRFQFCQNQLSISQDLQFIDHKGIANWQQQLKKRMPCLHFHQKYQKLQIKGKGRYSEVYQTARKIDNERFAVKTGQLNSHFTKELLILGSIDHPNIISFKQFYVSKGYVFMVLDYEDGGTLWDHMRKHSFTPKQRVKVYTNVLNGLEFLRIKKIVHRDIKPQNILYSAKHKNYKIADFGLAIKQKTPYQSIVGTPGYIAPEVFKDSSNQLTSHKSDIYSAGIMFYEMITNKCYYSGEDKNQILKNNISQKGDKNLNDPSIEQMQKKILKMMLCSSPSKRKSSYEILESSIFNNLVKVYLLTKISQNTKVSSNEQQEQQKKQMFNGFFNTVKNFLKIRSSSSY